MPSLWPKLLEKWKQLPVSNTPKPDLPYRTWARLSVGYPDKKFRDQILKRLREGADIGVNITSFDQLGSPGHNPKPTLLQKYVITDKLISLLKKQSLLGPFNSSNNIYTSPIFAINSYTLSGDIKKIRICHHLSFKGGASSINDLIDQEHKTVCYTGLRYVAGIAIAVGRNGLLWNLDQPAAYHSCKIRPNQYQLLGINWLGRTCCYCVLSFGLASAPQLYSQQADFATWIMKNKNPQLFQLPAITSLPAISLPNYMGPLEVYHMNKADVIPNGIETRIALFSRLAKDYNSTRLALCHYLDDWNGGHSNASLAWKQYNLCCATMNQLGLGYNDKSTPPTRIINSLGACINVYNQSIALQQKKADPYVELFKYLAGKTKIMKVEGLSAVGKGNFAAIFVPGLRARVRFFETLVHSVPRLSDYFRVSKCHKANLILIAKFIDKYARKGISLRLFYSPSWSPNVHVYVDASSKIGLGAWETNTNEYFCLKWSELKLNGLSTSDIDFKELFTVLLSFQIWGNDWSNMSVMVHSDCLPVVFMLGKKSCKLDRLDLLCNLLDIGDICITRRINYWVVHCPGKWNIVADGLSRFNWDIFKCYKVKFSRRLSCVSIAQCLLNKIIKFTSL